MDSYRPLFQLADVRPLIQSLARVMRVGVIGVMLAWGQPILVFGAERVVVSYFILERSISLSELTHYAETGKTSRRLRAYLDALAPHQREQLRTALQERLILEPVAVAQLLYSPLGEAMLEQVSTVVQSESRQANAQALRAALILAATDPQGLSALSLIRHYPAKAMRVDLTKGLEILKTFQLLVRQSQSVLASVRQQSQAEAANQAPISPQSMQALTEPGPWRVQVLSWTVTDNSSIRLARTGQPRTLNVEVYLPTPPPPTPIPLVVISHGLGADRYSYAYLGEHLASHGLAVAAIEHPGSSMQHLLSFSGGDSDSLRAGQEFIDRPLDISFILNQLSQYPAYLRPWPGRVNPQEVLVIGQSFGGYTALRLAGAALNRAKLKQNCPPSLSASLNVSLLLQCQALSLPPDTDNLTDPRVKAVLAINPISSKIFGPAGLAAVRVPVMIVAGSADTIAPALAEQVLPFTWLKTPHRYLVLMDEATHFSTIGQSQADTTGMPIPIALIGPTPRQSRYYLRALSLAFVNTYLHQDQSMEVYLSAAAAQALSQPPLTIHITQAWNATALNSALQNLDQPVSPPPVMLAH
ncbi:alpha/beta hydrolase [Thermosynechococcaceae cyanobacterium BACA0444]|uniref:Alpha/beta hydrolase n=1 Tax=Pseudocalidococcus azoricus BACA0444 TaxID=2918990 RepID=A0AAE4FRB0_9CYAN|nr:alpha/beta hydrolase [Pseudocalidococcus azoricus]MDS3859491.1 alpha/beta hydrolase [Pseudocalidococcus azoricus BACA0444]